MRVGLLTTSYPRYPGDYRGVFVKNLADGLRAAGCEVVVIEPRGYDVLKRGAGLIPNLKTSLAAKVVFPFYVMHFVAIAIRNAPRCEVLHANWSLAGFVAVIAAAIARRKVLLTERSPLLINTSNQWLNRAVGWVMRRCDTVVTISQAARRRLVEKFPDLDIGVIANGVDVDLFRPDNGGVDLGPREGTVDVLTVGRITAVKRLDIFVEALAEVAAAGHDIRAWIIGDGEARADVERRIAGHEALAGRVTLTGATPQSEVARWMASGDVFILCSEGESGGNVILEAMSAGLAVISTPVGWAEEYIEDGANGFISPVGDAGALARTLARLVDDAGLRARVREAARRTIIDRKLSWGGCAGRYLDAYKRLVAGGVA